MTEYLSRDQIWTDLSLDLARPNPGTQRLIKISDRFYQAYPPGLEVALQMGDSGLDELLSLPLVLTGEAGSGVTSVENWLSVGFWRTRPRAPVVRVSLSRRLSHEARGPEGEPEAGDKGVGTLLRGKFEGSDAESVDKLLWYFQGLAETNRQALFILYDLADFREAPKLLSGLRRLWDWYHFESLKMILSVPDTRILSEKIFSEIGSASQMVRPACFGDSEIDGLWSMHAPEKGGSLPHKSEIAAWTGGQPLLCRVLLKRIAEAPGRPFSEYTEWVFRHRPPHVYRWQSALAAIVHEDPSLRDLMRALLTGRAIPIGQIGQETLPLFAQGWLRFEGQGAQARCVIRSLFHREWGKEPIENPLSFVEVRS